LEIPIQMVRILNSDINFKLPGILLLGREITYTVKDKKQKTIFTGEDGFYFTRKKRVNQLLFL